MKKGFILMVFAVLFLVSGCHSKKETTSLENSSEQTSSWQTSTIVFKGKTIKLKETKVQSVISLGYLISEKTTGSPNLEPQAKETFTLSNHQSVTKETITLTVVNNSSTAKKAEDCVIIGFGFESNGYSHDKPEQLTFFPKNITIGSTQSDIIKAYGEPQSKSTPEDKHQRHKVLSYLSSDNTMKLIVTIENDRVSNVVYGYTSNPFL